MHTNNNKKKYSRPKTSTYQLANYKENFLFKDNSYAVIRQKTQSFEGKLSFVGLASSRHKEIVLFDTDTPFFSGLCQTLTKKISKDSSIREKLNAVVTFVAEQFSEGVDQKKIEEILARSSRDTVVNIFGEQAPIVSLEELIKEKVGNGHHFALLTACLLDHLIQKEILPKESTVRLYRSDTIYGRSAWTEWSCGHDAFILDPAHHSTALSYTYSTDLATAKESFDPGVIDSINLFHKGTHLEKAINFNVDPFTNSSEDEPKTPHHYLLKMFNILKQRMDKELQDQIRFLARKSDDITAQTLKASLEALAEKIRTIKDPIAHHSTQKLADLIDSDPQLKADYQKNSSQSAIKKTIQAILEMESDFLHQTSVASFTFLLQKIFSIIHEQINILEDELPSKGSFLEKLYPHGKKETKENKIKVLQAILNELQKLYPIGSYAKTDMLSFEEIIKRAISSLVGENEENRKKLETQVTKGTFFHRTRNTLQAAGRELTTYLQQSLTNEQPTPRASVFN